MASDTGIRLTVRSVDALTARGRDTMYWDRDLPGFGVRVYRSGRKVYIAQARGPAGTRRAVVGRHGKMQPKVARREAAAMIDRIRRGEAAVPAEPEPEPTVADLARRYMKAHVEVNCRPGSIETLGRIVRLYVIPELGHLPVSAVDRSHVSALHDGMRDKPYQANRTVDAIARMFSLAEAWELVPPGRNPCRSVRRYRESRRERFLTADEYRRVGAALDEAEAKGWLMASAVAAIRLLLLTGCRKNEIAALRWDDIDRTAREIRISDAKTGPRRVPLTPAVEWVLGRIPREDGNPWVIAGKKKGTHLTNLDEAWRRLRARAGVKDVRLHDARHSYASRALACGEGLSSIARLLGHSKVTTTARYAHLARDTEKAAAATVGASIGADLFGGGREDAAEGRE